MSVPEPSKILTPWASSGLKNAIPATANPVTGNAGYDQGFPAINMTPKEAGGIPPFGQDFNGILFSITEILRYLQAGGIPSFSSAMASAVSGYPKGALLLGSNGINIWQNQLDGNTTNPDSGGTNWIDVSLKILPKRTFAASDYIRIPDVPGGLIVQWGTCVGNGDTTPTVVAFPLSFPAAAGSILVTPIKVNAGEIIPGANASVFNMSAAGFDYYSQRGAFWLAVGN